MRRADSTIKVISVLSLFVAASHPFLNLQDIVKIIGVFLVVVHLNPNESELTSAFLTLAASITKWDNAIFSSQILDYLIIPEGAGEAITFIARLLHGRAFPRARREVENPPFIVQFLTGEEFPFLVTIVGDQQRAGSIFLRVRDSRGWFFWEVADVVQEMDSVVPPAISSFPPLPVFEPGSIGDDFDTLDSDETFADPDDSAAQSHITSQLNQKVDELQHKSIDFFIQFDLFTSVYQIIDDVKDILNRFDSIPDVSIVRIPVFHLTTEGESDGGSPLFRRFFGLLGEKNSQGNPEVHL